MMLVVGNMKRRNCLIELRELQISTYRIRFLDAFWHKSYGSGDIVGVGGSHVYTAQWISIYLYDIVGSNYITIYLYHYIPISLYTYISIYLYNYIISQYKNELKEMNRTLHSHFHYNILFKYRNLPARNFQ